MFLLRALRYLILLILAISVLRGVLGFVARIFLNATAGPERRPGAPPQASSPAESLKPESLKRDPVCGTFVASSTALQKDKNGKTFFFCSQECRDKF